MRIFSSLPFLDIQWGELGRTGAWRQCYGFPMRPQVPGSGCFVWRVARCMPDTDDE